MTEFTLLGNATPTIQDADDPLNVVVGVKFRPEINGWITKVRFWKAPANTGTHIGYLWDASTNAFIASTYFTNETASGWQEQAFAEPIPVVAGGKYTVSYYAPNGHYAVNTHFYDFEYNVYPLAAIGNNIEPNGVFVYPGAGPSATIPTQSFNAANYWIDAVFVDSLSQINTVNFKVRESGSWVQRTAVPKVRQSGAWVNAQPKRWTGAGWVDLP